MDRGETMRGKNTASQRTPANKATTQQNHFRTPLGIRPGSFFLAVVAALACFLFALQNAYAQVAIDSTTSAQDQLTRAANTLTFAHTTTTTGPNVVLVVGVSMNISSRNTTTVSGVTYNGVALTRAGAHNDSSNVRRTEIWYLMNPSSGVHNVIVTETIAGGGTVIGTVAGATTFTGADPTNPIRTYASNDSNGAASASAFVNVASAPNDYVLDVLAISSGTTATITSPAQTQQWALTTGGGTRDVYGFGSTRAGAPSVPMSENLSGNATWSDSAVSIQPLQADLIVNVAGSSTLFPANVTYTTTVTNNGSSTATAVNLTNALAAGLTLLSALPSGGGTCVGANCSWASVASGASVAVTITAIPSAPGGYALSASASASTPDFDSSNNAGTAVAYSEFDDCATTTATAGGTIGGVINTYFPGTATVSAGSTSISVGPGTGKGDNIAVGDLVLIIQMQDAAINSTNGPQYGDGISGSGATTLNNSGVYEYATATTGVSAAAGGTLGVSAAGPGGGLLYTYTSAPASSSQGARTFQVIRVPNYASATLSNTNSVTASAWNGSTGGVVALNVSGTLTLNNATVTASSLGFRGAAGLQLNGNGAGTSADYAFAAPPTYTTAGAPFAGADGSKGEGIAGTPRWVESGGTVVSSGQAFAEGYPNGSMARGAPGNAGGGVDGHESVMITP